MVEIEDLMIYDSGTEMCISDDEEFNEWIADFDDSEIPETMNLSIFIDNMENPNSFEMCNFLKAKELNFEDVMDILYNTLTSNIVWELIATEIAKRYPEEWNKWVED